MCCSTETHGLFISSFEILLDTSRKSPKVQNLTLRGACTPIMYFLSITVRYVVDKYLTTYLERNSFM